MEYRSKRPCRVGQEGTLHSPDPVQTGNPKRHAPEKSATAPRPSVPRYPQRTLGQRPLPISALALARIGPECRARATPLPLILRRLPIAVCCDSSWSPQSGCAAVSLLNARRCPAATPAPRCRPRNRVVRGWLEQRARRVRTADVGHLVNDFSGARVAVRCHHVHLQFRRAPHFIDHLDRQPIADFAGRNSLGGARSLRGSRGPSSTR